jgi:hypothetical protein
MDKQLSEAEVRRRRSWKRRRGSRGREKGSRGRGGEGGKRERRWTSKR